MAEPNVPQDAQTISAVVRALEEQGYTGQMRVVDGARIECFACRETFPASEVAAERIGREEGASDPDEMVAILGLRCPRCETRGVLVLNYGPESAPEEADVLLALQDERERPDVRGPA